MTHTIGQKIETTGGMMTIVSIVDDRKVIAEYDEPNHPNALPGNVAEVTLAQ